MMYVYFKYLQTDDNSTLVVIICRFYTQKHLETLLGKDKDFCFTVVFL